MPATSGSVGGDQWELTPRGSRMIGQTGARRDIRPACAARVSAATPLPEEGRFGERKEQTKPYEYGDPFHLHMPRTIRNAIDRAGPSVTPVSFEARGL